MSRRLQIAVLIADDLAPDVRATIESSVKRALDKLLVGFGGELYVGEFASHIQPPGRIEHTIWYASPRKSKS